MQQLTWSTELLSMIMFRRCWRSFIGCECLRGSSTQALCSVYKCLNGSGPAYLADSFQRVTDIQSRRRQRWSSSTLIVPVTRRATLGDRALSSCGRPSLKCPTRLSRQRLPSHHSVLRWRRICFPGLPDTDNMRHTDFVTWSWSAACLHQVNPVVWCGWWWWWWWCWYSIERLAIFRSGVKTYAKRYCLTLTVIVFLMTSRV